MPQLVQFVSKALPPAAAAAERVRGIALALGAAQAIDGLVLVFVPRFYGADADASLGACSSIFLTAGLTGLASAYT